jgi:iron-sulfur cluster repair protein YtfE (RIC family)
MEKIDKVKNAVTDAAKDAREKLTDAAKDARDKIVDVALDAKDLVMDVAHKIKGEENKDVLSLLKADHTLVSSLFMQIEAPDCPPDVREGLFAQLKYELDTHAQVEEGLFYPAVQKGAEGRTLITHALAEHAVVKQLLAELTALPSGSKDFLAKLSVLKEDVQHHVDMEESKVFSVAREVLDSKQRETLGARIQQEKLTLANSTGKTGTPEMPFGRGQQSQSRPAGSN